MKTFKKYLIITLLSFLSLIAISCENKEKEQTLDLSNLTSVTLSTNQNEDLINVLKNNAYKEISTNVYSKNAQLVDKTIVISEQKQIEKITNSKSLINSFKEKYKTTFFNNHLIIMTNYNYDCNHYNVYYNGEEMEIILDISNSNEIKEQTLIFELDLSTLNNGLDTSASLINSALTDINIHTVDEAIIYLNNDIFSLSIPTNDILLNGKIVDYETNLIFKNSISNITYIETTYYTKNLPLYEIKYDNTTLTIYNNFYFDITNENGSFNARLIKGSLLFALFYLDDFKEAPKFTTDILNFIKEFEDKYIFNSEALNEFISFAKDAIKFDYIDDFDSLTLIEKLEYINDNFDYSNKETLKKYISIFKNMFKNVKSLDITFNYNLNVFNNELCSKDTIVITNEVKRNDLIDIKNYLSIVPNNRYVIGWYDSNNELIDNTFNYHYYSDLNLYIKTVSNEDYEVNNYSITKVNSNYEFIYLPLYDNDGNKIDKIDNELFKDNTTIKEVYINENITTIGDHAFDGCINLEKIVIGKNVKTIGDYCFANCPKLSTIIFEEGLTTLGNYMFVNDISIKNVNIPSSIIDLKDHVFEGCTSIETFNVDIKNTKFYSKCNNIMEGTTLYYGCKNSTIPDGCVFIREFAFFGVTGLEEIYIPSCVVHIDTSAFQNCSGLKHAYISQSVMWNAKNAFNTGYNTIIDCEYYEKMSGWVKEWTKGTTVNWSVPQPTK